MRSATLGVAGQQREVGRGFHRHRLHHGQAEFLLDVDQPRRGLLAVQLQEIRLQRLDDVAEDSVIGIDRERNFRRAPLDPSAELARHREIKMPG